MSRAFRAIAGFVVPIAAGTAFVTACGSPPEPSPLPRSSVDQSLATTTAPNAKGSSTARHARTCPAEQTGCDDKCVDLQSNAASCGSCGNKCEAACSAGKCVDVRKIATSAHTSCALLSDGAVACWGDNRYGQLGFDTTEWCGTTGRARCQVSPRLVPGLNDVIDVALSAESSCVVRRGGTVSCWGNNETGELGYPATDKCEGDFDVATKKKVLVSCQSTPREVPGLTEVEQISLGSGHACALRSDGTVMCWGRASTGQLGYVGYAKCSDGRDCERAPRQVPDLSGVEQITASLAHTCGRMKDGTVRCWGENAGGFLGFAPSQCDQSDCGKTPTSVPSVRGAVDLTTGGEFSCAVVSDGAVMCWGLSRFAELGSIPAKNCESPSYEKKRQCVKRPGPVAMAARAAQIGAGIHHACARTDDGRVYCWGADDKNGGLGFDPSGHCDADTPCTPSPTEVPLGRKAVSISVGGWNTCAVLEDGTAKCWGANFSGQLGDGTTIPRPDPRRIVW
jgi:alpha-tubulin suppressor-like RCC1 family protein